MVTEVRIYFEGDKRLREGFHAFFSAVIELARRKRIRFQLIGCGATPVADFMKAMRSHASSFNILLKDAEGPAGEHLASDLKARGDWDAQVGATVQGNQVHFMVQVMEAWFLADIGALTAY